MGIIRPQKVRKAPSNKGPKKKLISNKTKQPKGPGSKSIEKATVKENVKKMNPTKKKKKPRTIKESISKDENESETPKTINSSETETPLETLINKQDGGKRKRKRSRKRKNENAQKALQTDQGNDTAAGEDENIKKAKISKEESTAEVNTKEKGGQVPQSQSKKKSKKAKQKKKNFPPCKLVKKATLFQALAGVRKLAEMSKENTIGIKQLLDEEDEGRARVNLQVQCFKIPKVTSEGKADMVSIKVPLPHTFVDDMTDVLLITQDLKRGLRESHEDSVNFYTDLLRTKKAAEHITEVMPLRQLKVENFQFEARRHLSNRFDVVLCDKALMFRVKKFLGKPFFEKKKYPIGVKMKAKDLKGEILQKLSLGVLHMKMLGSCSMMQVGRLNQPDRHIIENIMTAVRVIAARIPGGSKNIKTLHLKTDFSAAVPLYVSYESKNSVRDVILPKKPKKEIITGPLTTLKDAHVVVNPNDFTVELKKNVKTVKEKKKKKGKAVEKKTESKKDLNEAPEKTVEKGTDDADSLQIQDEIEEETQEENETEVIQSTKKTKAENESESEDEMEEQELAYLMKIVNKQKAEQEQSDVGKRKDGDEKDDSETDDEEEEDDDDGDDDDDDHDDDDDDEDEDEEEEE